MPSTTVHRGIVSHGSSIKRGTSTIADQGTIVTGLSKIDGFVAHAKDADTVIALASQSGGTATVRIHAAGVASSGEKVIYWEAWDYRRV